MPDAFPGTTIAIVGAGASGTLTAVQLLRRAAEVAPAHASGAHLRIVLIERSGDWGRGIAYSGTPTSGRLNVPARGMSAFPDRPEHFLRWLCARDPTAVPGTFAPRAAYGDYLAELLDSAIAGAPMVGFERVVSEVLAVRSEPGRARLGLADGRSIDADRVVFAIGNFAPSDPAIDDPSFYWDPRYIGTPWSATALDGLQPDRPVLLMGTGLTMFDIVATLSERGHAAPIHVLSRHGLLPQVHRVSGTSGTWSLDPTTVPPRIGPLVHAVRAAARQVQADGGDWHVVVDGIRPHVQAIWAALPLDERRRFLRHARPYWEIHRHRLAPEVLEVFEEARRTGRVVVHAGRLASFSRELEGVDVAIDLRGGLGRRTIRVGRVINCTGPMSAYRQLRHPLVLDLFAHGLARPDALHLGLDTAPDGALIDTHGVASDTLFTIGPPRKGALWETTAVPEIRQQAAALASRLLDEAGAPQGGVLPAGRAAPPPAIRDGRLT
jgi:uncharacterized NAD(P)/FAD-binding protein YdhS